MIQWEREGRVPARELDDTRTFSLRVVDATKDCQYPTHCGDVAKEQSSLINKWIEEELYLFLYGGFQVSIAAVDSDISLYNPNLFVFFYFGLIIVIGREISISRKNHCPSWRSYKNITTCYIQYFGLSHFEITFWTIGSDFHSSKSFTKSVSLIQWFFCEYN